MPVVPHELTAAELQHFETEGWVGPFPLLEAEEAHPLGPELRRCHEQTRGYFYPDEIEEGLSYYADTPWFQSLHSLSPRVAEIGATSEILDRVEQLLGGDLLLWGGICFGQGAGEALHWHTDTEYDYVKGVSVWMGVENTTPENALKILPGSHRFPEAPEVYISERGYDFDRLLSDEHVISLVSRWKPDAKVVRPRVRDGEFIIFNGKLWHGSDNPSDRYRVALGLRYCAPDQQVRIPLTYLHPVIFDAEPPPCILVRGGDHANVNRVINPPR